MLQRDRQNVGPGTLAKACKNFATDDKSDVHTHLVFIKIQALIQSDAAVHQLDYSSFIVHVCVCIHIYIHTYLHTRYQNPESGLCFAKWDHFAGPHNYNELLRHGLQGLGLVRSWVMCHVLNKLEM